MGVLTLGALFIFLTFHTMDKNYLYEVMHGTLTWWNLRWYLILAFFFQPPFLAIWLLVYALLYYGLARTGRERWVLHVTAAFAVLYIGWFLQDLIAYRNALLVAGCFGAACLLAGKGSQRSLGWFWLIQPWIWLVFLFFLFRAHTADLQNLNPECVILSGWSLVLFAGLSLVAWRRKFYAAWSWMLPFAFVSFLLFTNTNYTLAGNYQNLFCLGLTLPHYFLGEFVVASVLLMTATIYRRLLPSGSLLWLDGINLLLIALALADLRLSQIMGVRLDWQAVMFGADFKMVWRLAKPYLPGLAAGLFMLTGLYVVLVGLWQRADSSKALRLGNGGRFLLVSFLLLGLAGSWFARRNKAEGQSAILLGETSSLFHRSAYPIMDKKTFVTTAEQLGLSSMLERPPATPAHPPRDLNVVLIFQESTYNKYRSLFDDNQNTQPLLSKYKDRMELFPNFFFDFAGSMNARFASLSGLYPVRDYQAFTYHRVNVKSLFEVLHEHGYVSSVFYSSFLDYTGFRDFLQGRDIDVLYDADTMPGRDNNQPVSWGVSESVTLKAMQSQIKEYATNHQKFFLSYFPVAPHYPFDGTPQQFRKFRLGQMGDYTAPYLNELLYMDWVVSSIVGELKNSGLLDNTLVIITDDHGEMLGANGGPIGHGWAATPDLVNIPLIIMDPARPGYHVNLAVGSQVDLLPTVLDLLGIPLPAGELYQGRSLYSAGTQTERNIYLNSFNEYAVVENHEFLHGNRETESSTNGSFDVFTFTNNGAKTLFYKANPADLSNPSISEFDQFQENFSSKLLPLSSSFSGAAARRQLVVCRKTKKFKKDALLFLSLFYPPASTFRLLISHGRQSRNQLETRHRGRGEVAGLCATRETGMEIFPSPQAVRQLAAGAETAIGRLAGIARRRATAHHPPPLPAGGRGISPPSDPRTFSRCGGLSTSSTRACRLQGARSQCGSRPDGGRPDPATQ
jgi:phosphoglycerol transferase MdoB-like AlkP superfamily enzyme